MHWRHFVLLVSIPALAQNPNQAGSAAAAKEAAAVRAAILASPELPFTGTEFAARPAGEGWESGMISWVALDKTGTIYELQRGDKADPVLVLDREGRILRSWGKGLYKIPHAIRLDPAGNVWTVDAASSTILKNSPTGDRLMTIEVGEQP